MGLGMQRRTVLSCCAAAALVLVAGCGRPETPAVRMIEAEQFAQLRDAEVVEADADGKRVVTFDADTSEASTTLDLPKGAWRVVGFMQGISPEHDSVWLEVAGQRGYLWVGSYGAVSESANDAEFLLPGGPVPVRLFTKERRVRVDRLRFEPIPDDVVRMRRALDRRKDLDFAFRPYCFSGTKLPEGDFAQPLRARDVLGDYTVSFRYFDAAHRPVTQAAAPGRYGAVAEIKLPDGRITRRFATLYRLAEGIDWWNTRLDASIALPAQFGLDARVQQRQAPALREGLKWSLARSMEQDREMAILLAGLREMDPDAPPADAFSDPMARDRAWWVTMKRTLYAEQTRDLPTAPMPGPAVIEGEPAPVVREGTLAEAGLSAEAIKAIDGVCAAWAADSDEALAVCIVRNGVIALHKAYGQRDGRPMTVDDPSWMASITKLMAGTLLTMFVDAGRVDPDAEAARYLPPLRGRPTRRPLLVRHLYTHTSGLWGHWGAETHDLAEQVADLAPWLPIGHKYEYNGTGLELGGKVLEAVSGTGEPLPHLYRRLLLEPLGMDRTEVADSGGGAQSTALDMARLGQMLLNRGAYGDRRFFGEKAFAQFLPHRLVDEIGPDTETVYGFGCSWYEAEGLGKGTFGHGAASTAVFRVMPEHRMVVVMCRNAAGRNYARHADRFIQAVAAAAQGAR